MTDIVVAAGTSREIDVPVVDGDGAPFFMGGGKSVFWVGKDPTSTGDDVIIILDANAIDVDGVGLWTVKFLLDPEDTQDKPRWASYYWECRVWDVDDNEYVIANGRFEIAESLTADAPEPPVV